MNGYPALLVVKERALVVGDLHIGIESKLEEEGVSVENVADRMAERLLQLYDKAKAKSIILLGDVKDSISFPTGDEYESIRRFFMRIGGIEIRIARGNHDAHMERIAKSAGLSFTLENEVLLADAALLHGKAWHSEAAMSKDYLITAHSHFAIEHDGYLQKAWLVAKVSDAAASKYAKFNKSAKLVVMPAFNDLILGSRISERTKNYSPLLKHGIFDWKSAKIYTIDGVLVGSAESASRAAK